jgi:hypothetical protein
MKVAEIPRAVYSISAEWCGKGAGLELFFWLEQMNSTLAPFPLAPFRLPFLLFPPSWAQRSLKGYSLPAIASWAGHDIRLYDDALRVIV